MHAHPQVLTSPLTDAQEVVELLVRMGLGGRGASYLSAAPRMAYPLGCQV